MIIEAVEAIALQDIGVGKNRSGNMGQVVAVLVKLLPDPVLPDFLALKLNIQGTVRVRGEFQKVKFLADMFNGIGKIKSVKE